MEAPANGVQHQPVILPTGFYGPPKPAPELTYRQRVGSEGVTAADATLEKLVAAGMTDTPKVIFDNSILNKGTFANGYEVTVGGKKIEEKKDAKADPNATPETDKAMAEENAKKAEEKKKDGEKADAKKADDAEKAPAPKGADEAGKETAPKADVEKAPAAPPKAGLIQKQDIIGEPGYDWSVYNFTHDNISGQHEGNYRETAYPANGWAATPWSTSLI